MVLQPFATTLKLFATIVKQFPTIYNISDTVCNSCETICNNLQRLRNFFATIQQRFCNDSFYSLLTSLLATDNDGLVSQALMTGNFDGAVDICFKADRMAEALILAVAGGPELFARTQKRYLHQARSSIAKVRAAFTST